MDTFRDLSTTAWTALYMIRTLLLLLTAWLASH